MLVYPQLASGALSQLPVQMRHQFRTLVNTAPDGSVVKIGDGGAETVEWQLNYSALSDAEMQALQQFFTDAEGSLNAFTFVDPMANLLAWSGDLGNTVWDKDPFLTATGGGADPVNGGNGWHIANSGAAAQSLSQTLEAPGGYVYCFSAYAKSATPATVTLLVGSARFERTLGPGWQGIDGAAASDSTATSVTIGIEFGAGAGVDIYGLQVEPQASPSIYKPSTTGGCYENARLRDDTLSFTSTGVNCHSATVNIIYASHL